MTRRWLECPACYGAVVVADTEDTQTEGCRDCGKLYTVTWDDDRWTLAECEPPDWREVEGDLRLHRRC